jgi:uridine kinase
MLTPLFVLTRPQVPWVVLISTDSFYKPLTPEESKQAFQNEYDFDSPNAWDWDLMVETLKSLKEGRKVEIPNYSFVKHCRLPETATVYGATVIILEVCSELALLIIRAIWRYMTHVYSNCWT